jgi:hypothetical protein
MPKATSTPSKAGTYDALLLKDGREVPVYIIEDEPTYMVVEVLEDNTVITLAKLVQ